MALEILRDPRLKEVEYRDLMQLSKAEVLREVLIYTPWLAASLLLAHHRLWVPALACSFMFFLCGLRQVHNAFHYAVGVSRRGHEWLMFVLSPLMMSSMHAVQWNHLRHHRYCMDDEDVEAMSARMPGWKALLTGPQFPVRLHSAALRHAKPRVKRWIAVELATMAAFAVAAFTLVDWVFLQYHVVAMIVGQCFSAFFAVWTVHHDCDRSHFIARTLRNGAKSFVSYNMFYHMEHHLFPAVPTCHLPRLAERLDRAAPELRAKQVF